MAFTRGIRFIALLMMLLTLNHQIAFAYKTLDPSAMKAKVEARGVGQGIRVVLIDKTEQKGTIVSIGSDGFSVKPKGAAQPVDVAYAQIASVHRDKLSTGAKVGITAGVAVGVIAIIAIVLTINFKHSFKV